MTIRLRRTSSLARSVHSSREVVEVCGSRDGVTRRRVTTYTPCHAWIAQFPPRAEKAHDQERAAIGTDRRPSRSMGGYLLVPVVDSPLLLLGGAGLASPVPMPVEPLVLPEPVPMPDEVPVEPDAMMSMVFTLIALSDPE